MSPHLPLSPSPLSHYFRKQVSNNAKPLILGVSGASGLIYAVRALKFLLEAEYAIELVASKSSFMVWQSENSTPMPAETQGARTILARASRS